MKTAKHVLAVAIAVAGMAWGVGLVQGAEEPGGSPGAAASASTSTNSANTNSASDALSPWRDRLQEAAKELNLTEEQKEKLKPIFRKLMAKARALREDRRLSASERLERAKALREELGPEIQQVLTAEQYEKWQKMPWGSPGLRLQEAIQELNLTEEQKGKLKPIFREPMEAFRALQADEGLSVEQKLAKFKALREKVAPKVKDVLTGEQYEKYEKLGDRVREELKRRLQQARED